MGEQTEKRMWLEAGIIESGIFLLSEKLQRAGQEPRQQNPEHNPTLPLSVPAEGCCLGLSHHGDRCGPFPGFSSPNSILYFPFTLTPSTAFSSALSRVYKWMQNNLWSKKVYK